jgi:Mrp family chromosome partitioning ATPase
LVIDNPASVNWSPPRDDFGEGLDRALADEAPQTGFARRPRETLGLPILPALAVESARHALLRLVPGIDAGGTLAVVGSTSNEGRSIVAAALGIALARDTRLRIVIVDLCLERPAQAPLFRVENSPGLGEHWADGAALRLVAGEPERRLWLLPAGSGHDRSWRLGSLFGSSVLRALRQRFDWVIVDLPSIDEVPDAVLVAAATEYRVVVARHRHSGLHSLEQIVDLLGDRDSTGLLLTCEKRTLPAWLNRMF